MISALMVIGMAAVSAPPGWPTYVNARYGFSVCRPPELRPQREAENGDGRHFQEGNGADLAVYGSNDPDNGGYQEELNYFRDDARKAGGRVSYEAHGANWGVISGTRGQKIFYTKVFKRGDQLLTFDFSYPKVLSSHYAGVTARMVGCFRPGISSF